MKKGYLITGVLLLLLSGVCSCKTSKNTTSQYPEPPSWISERPVETGCYYGIGSAVKRGSAQIYRQRATEKALSDIAGQIATQIKSNASMYRVEDKFGVREVYENRIKSQSEDFLEGQVVIDDYQNEHLYYVLYRLSASTYEQKRNKRKQKAFEAGEQFYYSGIEKAEEGAYQLSVHFLLKAIEAIYPFRAEKTWIVTNNDTIDLFANPLEKLKSISEELKLNASTTKNKVSGNFINGDDITFTTHDHHNRPVPAVPILFSIDGGYLISNREQTDSSGSCKAPAINIPNQQSRILLTAKIDLTQWVNQSTEIMEIRNLIKKWPVSTYTIELEN